MTRIVLDDSSWRALPGVRALPATGPDGLVQLERRGATVWARRRKPWIIGRAELDGVVVEVPSPIPSGVLVPLVMYADGVDLSVFPSLPPSVVEGRGEVFHTALAKAYVREVRQRIGADGARRYVELRERARVLRGRPLWTSTFGKHPSDGVVCRTHRLVTDHLLNQLVLAGLEHAFRLLRDDVDARRDATRLVARWRMLAGSCVPTADAFGQAFQSLDRLTHHYRVPLQLARILLLRIQPDPFHGGDAVAPAVALNLAALLEGVLARVVAEAIADVPDADVVPQDTDETSFVDGVGDGYRKIRPDLLVRRRGVPLAVLDAKFKPRYVEGPPDRPVPKANRVETADLFQIAFYQARTQQRYGLPRPPVAAIVAPQLGGEVPDPARRTVRWMHEADGLGARVVPLPLVALVAALRSGRPAIDVAPELRDLVLTALQDRGTARTSPFLPAFAFSGPG